jgi:hypothetical protein
MPDLLHPAAPVVPCAPSSPVPLPPHLALALPPLRVDVAVPDKSPARGDRVPGHLLWAQLSEPLPPVLRPDRVLRCPPCHGDCRQGRGCPARPVPLRRSVFRAALDLVALAALLVGCLAVFHLLFAIPRP